MISEVIPTTVLRRGAEAELHDGEWLGRQVVVKRRVPKGYRHPDLDGALRAQRTKNEARLMLEARSKGVPIPVIYDIDLAAAEITMERIFGPRVKDQLNVLPEEEAKALARLIGKTAALLHSSDIVHGDLTTSNMLLREDGSMCMIDFSLGEKTDDVEKKGVDMHLLFEAFHSAHYMRENLLEDLVESYEESYEGAGAVIQRVKDIEKRGRYT